MIAWNSKRGVGLSRVGPIAKKVVGSLNINCLYFED